LQAAKGNCVAVRITPPRAQSYDSMEIIFVGAALHALHAEARLLVTMTMK
jgi:hypothetical protein